MGLSTERKQEYAKKLRQLLAEYTQVLVVSVDNIGSNHLQKMRRLLRDRAVLLLGKNTMIRRVLRDCAEENPKIESLIAAVRGNVGFIFTKEDLNEIRALLSEHTIAAQAKSGAIAPCDVTIKAGLTGLDPNQTAFLQALNISSKINRGQIEIINDVHLIKTGDKVGSSEAALLAKLNITPFTYGLNIRKIYDDGFVYGVDVLDLGDEDILKMFARGVQSIASLSLAIGFPTVASIPHVIANGFKNILFLSIATDYTIDAAKELKEAVENPEAFLAALPAVTEAPAAAEETKQEESKQEEAEEEEEDDEDMDGFGLFD